MEGNRFIFRWAGFSFHSILGGDLFFKGFLLRPNKQEEQNSFFETEKFVVVFPKKTEKE
ncbi:hypothetical protein MicvaDRAFT_2353 [Microcoleus vaginatus FGP-2]|nr:hypothetical protein MicvaDRAFT_2353 [Microcoleus vaginatus FGP-2]